MSEETVGPWDGEDTPPIGTPCQFHESTSGWNRAVVKYASDHCVVLERDNGYEVCIFTIFPSRTVRPVPTPDQIAEVERDNGINEMIRCVKDHPRGRHGQNHLGQLKIQEEACCDLYDAGYRKQVTS